MINCVVSRYNKNTDFVYKLKIYNGIGLHTFNSPPGLINIV